MIDYSGATRSAGRHEFGPTACRTCGDLSGPGGWVGGVCGRCLARSLLGGDAVPAEKRRGTTPRESRRLGDYELNEEIAHGGMGVVYRARQISLDRVVAVKLLLLGRFADSSSIHRFLREAEASAQLRHPNIVTVHEVGIEEGQYYLAMDYIEGKTLGAEIARGLIGEARCARYGRVLATAIQYAHDRGVIHRDLKPSNILIDAQDEPLITDFGLAKRLDDFADLTVTGELLGSPNYLSPEQAAGAHGMVGPRSDVFALGAILYECLTGRPPFLAETLGETLTQIRDGDPPLPRVLVPGVSADLEAVVMRCLEKDPSRRYATAKELAEDLGRFMRFETTRARPRGRVARGLRWCRRRPVHATALALAIGGAALAVILSYRTHVAYRAAAQANARMAADLRRVQWEKAEAAAASGHTADSLMLFARLLRDKPDDPALTTRLLSLLSSRAFAIPLGRPLEHDGPVMWVEFSRDGRRLATASVDGGARIWDTEDGTLARRMEVDGRLLRASFAAGDQSLFGVAAEGRAILWRTRDGAALRVFEANAAPQGAAAISMDGARVAAVADGRRVLVADSATGAAVFAVPYEAPVSAMAFSRDGGRLASGELGGTVRVWGFGGAGPALIFSVEAGSPVSVLAFSPDGGRLALGTRDGMISIWALDDPDGPLIQTKERESAHILGWSGRGDQLLAGRFGRSLELWDAEEGRSLGAFTSLDDGIVLDARWAADDEAVLLAYRGGMAAVHDVARFSPVQEPFEHRGPVARAVWSPDNRMAATASHDGTARLWDVSMRASPPVTATLPGRAGPSLRSREGRLLITANSEGRAYVLDALTGKRAAPVLIHDRGVAAAELSPDGRRVLVCAGGAYVWDSLTGKLVAGPVEAEEQVTAAAWSPDGQWFATVSTTGDVRRWDAESGAALGRAVETGAGAHALQVAPDSSAIVALCDDAAARVIDVERGRERFPRLRHQGRIWTVDFSPDSRFAVTASVDRTAQIWDLRTGERVLAPLRHERGVLVARFSPDGRIIASGGEDRTVRLWDSATGRPLGAPLPQSDRVWIVAFSRDGRRLLALADKVDSRVWDVATGLPVTEPVPHMGPVLRGWFLPAENEFLTATHRGALARTRFGDAPLPAPDWLPELAEALAGRRLNDEGDVLTAPTEVMERLRHMTSDDPGEAYYSRWAAWFFSRKTGAAESWTW